MGRKQIGKRYQVRLPEELLNGKPDDVEFSKFIRLHLLRDMILGEVFSQLLNKRDPLLLEIFSKMPKKTRAFLVSVAKKEYHSIKEDGGYFK